MPAVVEQLARQIGRLAVAVQKIMKVLNSSRMISVDFPAWMVDRLDKEARHLGVTRQSVIKMWIAERLK